MLNNLGLNDLVTETKTDYVQSAVRLALDLPRLSNLRSTLRSVMQRSPLMDHSSHAANIEKAYREIWRRWAETNVNV